MVRYPCDGWLHLAVDHESNIMTVTLKHKLAHKAYKDIRLPDKWKEYIEDHARTKTPGQVRFVVPACAWRIGIDLLARYGVISCARNCADVPWTT